MKLSIAATALLSLTPASHAFVTRSTLTSPFQSSTFISQNNNVRDRRKDIAVARPHSRRRHHLQMSTLDKDTKKDNLTLEESIINDVESGSILQNPTIPTTRSHATSYLSKHLGETGASVIYTKLEQNAVTLVNGYSGGANLPLLDQFHTSHPRHSIPGAPPPIRWITNSNESSAGHVMEGYAKACNLLPDGKPPAGVVIATSGPGVTNLITPLQDAMCDGVPMVVMCGQAATFAPPDAFQSADAVGLTTPCTKWSYKIKSAVELPFVLDYAFFVARNGRPGPVFIDLPKDLLMQEITEDNVREYVEGLPVVDMSQKDAEEPESLVKLVANSRPNLLLDNSVSDAILHMGTMKEGLDFELQKINGNPIELRPIALPKDDPFHLDHHPSNTIIAKEDNRMGILHEGSPLMTEVVDMIRNAERPFIIAGQGCNDSPEELKRFAESLNIPVATTLHGLGCFDERHELALNMIGMHGHPTPNFMIQEADLVICIGSRFDDRITGNNSQFIPEAKKAAAEKRGGVIHVDIRLTENNKQVKADYFVHSTGNNFLNEINQALQNRDATPNPNNKSWITRMKLLQQEFPVKIPKFTPQSIPTPSSDGSPSTTTVTRTPMSAQYVIQAMNNFLVNHPDSKINDCIFSTGVGIHQMVAAQLLTWTQPRQMISSGSLGTMGVALGFAIGAKLSDDSKICIAIDGDGSFNMTFTELKTLAEQGIAVKIIILDNESQMMVEYWQRLFMESRYIAVRNEKNPDYVKLAGSFGIKALYADCEENLEDHMREFLFEDSDQPVLFHVKIERTPCLPLVAPGSALDKMILIDEDFEVDKSAAPS